MTNEKKSLIIVVIYVFIMLFVCFMSVIALKKANDSDSYYTDTDSSDSDVSQSMYLPVYVESEYQESNAETNLYTDTEQEIYFTVKNYEWKIGVFNSEGKLMKTIEVYVKTLPKADRDMLEEGIEVKSGKELDNLIEDYTG